MHTNRLVDTIAQLKEKKAYYQKLSEQAEKGDKTEFKDGSKTETKKQSPKKENKTVSINETEFPSMN